MFLSYQLMKKFGRLMSTVKYIEYQWLKYKIFTFKSLTFKLKPSSDESVELLREENVLGSADPPRVDLKRTPSEKY